MSIAVSRLAQELPGARIVGSPEARVSGITYDSRKVRPGDLFVCIRGFVHDGHEFAAAALERGARVLRWSGSFPWTRPRSWWRIAAGPWGSRPPASSAILLRSCG